LDLREIRCVMIENTIIHIYTRIALQTCLLSPRELPGDELPHPHPSNLSLDALALMIG
jgi:hypothetical protein